MELNNPENISSVNVFIDGLARSGKSSLCQTIVSLKNSEHIDMATNLEYIITGLVSKKISPDFAKTYLKTYFNQTGYNKLIGRGVNFRPTDFTGVANFRDPKIYHDRLKIFSYGKKKYHYKKTHIKVDNLKDPILETLNSKYFFFPFQSHFLLSYFKEFKNLDLNYKIIEILRNPIDVVFSIISRGTYDFNRKKDIRLLTLTILHKKKIAPWFVNDFVDDYLKCNKSERAALIVINNLEKMIMNSNLIKPLVNKKIFILPFEKFVTNTKKEMQNIAKFLKTKTTHSTDIFIKNANCPRTLDVDKTNEKLEFLSNKIKNKVLLKKLIKLEYQYKKNLYNFK
jgi:hypothetical protein